MLKERVITGLSGWTMVAILVAVPVAGIAGLFGLAAPRMANRRPVAVIVFFLLSSWT